jgi:DNA-binding response OmpR family regulator
MTDAFRILVTDRNRHVRDFLKRELGREGYEVILARDGTDLIHLLNSHDRCDLLVLDTEIAFGCSLALIESLVARRPALPIVIHSFAAEQEDPEVVRHAAALVTKGGNAERLKAAVAGVLAQVYPGRGSRRDGADC